MEIEDIVKNAKAELSKEKDGAVWVTMMEVSDYINFSAIAKTYYNKSANWILQRLHGYNVNGKAATFKEDEYQLLIDSLRDIASKLNTAADNLEKAK